MEKIVEQGLLYDFYGELLTKHQQSVYEDVVFNDLSLSEIADEQGITRQGVHDLIRRCDRTLLGYEEKLGLIAKFQKTKEKVTEIHRLTEEFSRTQNQALIEAIGRISNEILSESRTDGNKDCQRRAGQADGLRDDRDCVKTGQ